MRISVAACCLLVALVAGCSASQGQRAATASTQPHAECLVCKANADLACIDVAVNSTTPTYVYKDKTYYFCSDDCRREFAKHPSQYVRK